MQIALFCKKPESEHSWLKGSSYERIDKIAEHLRGNDLVMWEVSYRHKQLYDAIQTKNIQYAKYQLKKIILAMKKGKERRPGRAPSYNWFFKKARPPMLKALLEKKNEMAAYKKFTNNCIVCHKMEKVLYMPVKKYWEE